MFNSSFIVAQNGLKDLTEPKKVFIGNIISNEHLDDPVNFRNGLANPHLLEEYNAVALENYMKMSFILPSSKPEDIHDFSVEQLRATLNEDKIEKFLNYDDWSELRKRGHAMIWFNQAPEWLDVAGPTWTGQQVFEFSRKYILALGQICGDKIDEWDVINEAISDDVVDGQRIWRQRTWYRRANDGSMTDWGEATYENYIKMLFVWARESQPQARLIINDYGIEFFSNAMNSKNRFMRDQVKALKSCGAPIDGVGFQSHLTLSDMVSVSGDLNTAYIDAVEESIKDLSNEDIEVTITELDIRICNEDRDEAFQEVAYQAFVEMALSQPNCHVVLIWGLRDEDNWITLRNDQFFTNCEDAVIVDGDNYNPKPAYDGVAAAITALPDQQSFGFNPLVEGEGTTADCGGSGSIIPDILKIDGPRAVFAGDQVDIDIHYLATDNQDVVVYFQLNSPPYTVLSQKVYDVNAGSGSISAKIDIPIDAPSGENEYRYLAFIAPDGGGYSNLINETIQYQVSVLDEDSQVIISCSGPESVSPGETIEVNISYNAGMNQEIVVWFQLDGSPFTTYQEFRQSAEVGRHDMIAELFIPNTVPLAQDAYQYQTLLVPTGGNWADRISNVAQQNIDVVLASNVIDTEINDFGVNVFPNPVINSCNVFISSGQGLAEMNIYSSIGEVLDHQNISNGVQEVELDLQSFPAGLYWLSVRRGNKYGVTKLLKH